MQVGKQFQHIKILFSVWNIGQCTQKIKLNMNKLIWQCFFTENPLFLSWAMYGKLIVYTLKLWYQIECPYNINMFWRTKDVRKLIVDLLIGMFMLCLRIGERRYSQKLWKIRFSQIWSVDSSKIILNLSYMKKIVRLCVYVKICFC